jgi:hypothetical protein
VQFDNTNSKYNLGLIFSYFNKKMIILSLYEALSINLIDNFPEYYRTTLKQDLNEPKTLILTPAGCVAFTLSKIQKSPICADFHLSFYQTKTNCRYIKLRKIFVKIPPNFQNLRESPVSTLVILPLVKVKIREFQR